jgi:DNA-binding Lrp family transcriptional regulator
MKELGKIGEVKEAHMVYGDYDIIAHLETDRMEDLTNATRQKIRRLEEVISTFT